MRVVRLGRELGLEERRQEESMCGGFDSANFVLRATSNHWESRFHGRIFVLRIHFIVAEKFLFNGVLHIERLQVRAGPEPNFGNDTREFWSGPIAVGHSTRDRINHDVLRAGIVFGGVGVLDPQYVARTLYQSVLKAASSGDERPVTAAGELNAFQHSLEALVGTAGRGPESIEAFENLLGFGFEERGSGNPAGFDRHV